MSDPTATPTPTTPAPAAPAPAPAAAPVEDSPSALRTAALEYEAPAAAPAPADPAPTEAGENWAAIAKAARDKREERERQASRSRQESDAEKRIREREAAVEARERALDEDPMGYLDRAGKLKPHYEKLSEQILSDGKQPPLSKDEIDKLVRERAQEIVEETLRARDEQHSASAQERQAADAQANALRHYEAHVSEHGKTSPIMSLAPRKRADYAVHAANLLREAERPITFDAVMRLSEHLAREDFPGLAQPTPAGAGADPTTIASEARSDGGAPRGITAAFVGQSSVSEDDDDSPQALRAAAMRFAEKHAE